MDWKLIRGASGEPEIKNLQDEDEEDLSLGFAYMKALLENAPTLSDLQARGWYQSSNDQAKDEPSPWFDSGMHDPGE